MADHRSRTAHTAPAPGWNAAVRRGLCATLMLLALLLVSGGAVAEKEPTLSIDDSGASAGHLQLSWQWVGDGDQPVYDIEMDRRENFASPERVYRGEDGSTVLSGLADDTYYFRARVWLRGEPVTDWSEPVPVTVEHHPLEQALGLFALGAVVFAATVALIITGRQRTQEGA